MHEDARRLLGSRGGHPEDRGHARGRTEVKVSRVSLSQAEITLGTRRRDSQSRISLSQAAEIIFDCHCGETREKVTQRVHTLGIHTIRTRLRLVAPRRGPQ